jgi:hypothetical protein
MGVPDQGSITIFCDFCQFPAKKLAFFSKTNVMIKFSQKLAVARAKNANIFAKFFGENIFKIKTSIPGNKFLLSELVPGDTPIYVRPLHLCTYLRIVLIAATVFAVLFTFNAGHS